MFWVFLFWGFLFEFTTWYSRGSCPQPGELYPWDDLDNTISYSLHLSHKQGYTIRSLRPLLINLMNFWNQLLFLSWKVFMACESDRTKYRISQTVFPFHNGGGSKGYKFPAVFQKAVQCGFTAGLEMQTIHIISKPIRTKNNNNAKHFLAGSKLFSCLSVFHLTRFVF